jgi:hypothetical protein
VERRVDFGDGSAGIVSLNEPVLRYGSNPILTAHQVDTVWTEPHLRVMTVHSAGVAVVGSETEMLFRSTFGAASASLGWRVVAMASRTGGSGRARASNQPPPRIGSRLASAEIAQLEASWQRQQVSPRVRDPGRIDSSA